MSDKKERILRLYRGLPGSGKSTMAKQAGGPVFEADQFFMDGGEYKFNPKKLKDAHQWCRDAVEEDMMFLKPEINVANTFTQKWEFSNYLDLASSHGYKVEVYCVQGDWGNVHGVPEEALRRMSGRWESYEGETIIDNWKSTETPSLTGIPE
jgi:predicted kinase